MSKLNIKINWSGNIMQAGDCGIDVVLAGCIKAGDVDTIYEKIVSNSSAINEDTVVSSFIKECCNYIAKDIKKCEDITDTNIRRNRYYSLCFHGTPDEIHVAFSAGKYFDMYFAHIGDVDAVIEW